MRCTCAAWRSPSAFAVRGVRFEKKLLGRTIRKLKETEELQERKIRFYEKGEETIHNDEPNKYTLKGWTIQKQEKDPQGCVYGSEVHWLQLSLSGKQ